MSTLFLPENAHAMDELRFLMQRLRDPETGCRWDLQQTFKTIAPYTIEEAYEVLDAIECNDVPHLREELGDLLLQIVFHAQMASEQGWFDLDDVARGLVAKMIRRHPHVFPDGTLLSKVDPENRPDEAWVRSRWEEIKQEERLEKGQTTDSVLGHIPESMAPLKRAEKLQRNAAKIGFEWDSVGPVMEKLHEEIDELAEAIDHGHDRGHIEEEMGDVLFVCVNLCRHLGLDPELVMKRANNKFETRFRHIEAGLKAQGISPQQADLATMEALWQAAKTR
jgi:ATP diphosphatase